MKHVKIIVAIGLITALAIVIVFISINNAPQKVLPSKPVVNPFQEVSSNSNEAPDAYTTSFYSWYLAVLSKNPDLSSSNSFKEQTNQWLTPEFVANWDSIVAQTDQDPIILSSDYLDSWVTQITSTIQDQSPDSSTVLVTLGTPSETHKLFVRLLKDGNQWKISSVDPAT